MAVAWIGDRGTSFEQAAAEVAVLLQSSRCPVFTIDSDIHGARAGICLAELVGAAYDQPEGAALARETALFTDRGGMFIAAGEARRRADVVVVVGALPDIHLSLLSELAATAPDLPAAGSRQLFVIGDAPKAAFGTAVPMLLSCGGEASTLAALRASCAGRKVATPVPDFDRFAEALAGARFSVFLFSGHDLEGLAVEMLLGLVADLNRKRRAAALFLPASDSAWGGTLASTWLTGFPMRSGFLRGFPEHDPWRFDAARMLADGEADLHLAIGTSRRTARSGTSDVVLVALEPVNRPVAGAAVTIAIGKPGVDHDAVLYSSRAGTLAFMPATAASPSPPAASVLRAIAARIPGGEAAPC